MRRHQSEEWLVASDLGKEMRVLLLIFRGFYRDYMEKHSDEYTHIKKSNKPIELESQEFKEMGTQRQMER